VTGSFPVHEDGATSVFGLGGSCVDGSFGGVAGLLCLPCFTFNGGGSGSTGFGGLASFGVFFAISNFVLQRLCTLNSFGKSQKPRDRRPQRSFKYVSQLFDPTISAEEFDLVN